MAAYGVGDVVVAATVKMCMVTILTRHSLNVDYRHSGRADSRWQPINRRGYISINAIFSGRLNC